MTAPTVSVLVVTPQRSAPTRCTWADCHEIGRVTLDGWRFCLDHGREHKEMSRRGEIRGQHIIRTKDVDPRPNDCLTREELLAAVIEESKRPVPPAAWEIERRRARPRANHGRRLKRPAA